MGRKNPLPFSRAAPPRRIAFPVAFRTLYPCPPNVEEPVAPLTAQVPHHANAP